MTMIRPVGCMVLSAGATVARSVSRSAGPSMSVRSTTTAATEVEGIVATETPAVSTMARTRPATAPSPWAATSTAPGINDAPGL